MFKFFQILVRCETRDNQPCISWLRRREQKGVEIDTLKKVL